MSKRITLATFDFYDARIKKCSITQEQSLSLTELPVDTIQAVVFSTSQELIRRPELIGQPLTVFVDVDKQIGFFRTTMIRRIGKNYYEINGQSPVGELGNSQHLGGIYSGETTLEVIKDICDGWPVDVDAVFQDRAVYGWLPIDTRRNNLARILLRTGATVRVKKNGTLWITAIGTNKNRAAITADRIYLNGAGADYSAPVSDVEVVEYSVTEGGSTGTIFSGTASQGYRITFSQPMYNLTVSEGSTFTILDSGANYAVLSAGTGVLSGSYYIHSKRTLTKHIADTAVPNVVTLDGVEVISANVADFVLARLSAFYRQTEMIASSVIRIDEMPGDVLQVYHPYDAVMVSACLTKGILNFSQKIKSEERLLIGFVPPDPSIGEYDAVDVLTEDGTWVVPQGVTTIRVVLIGGGSGGWSGLNGEDAAEQPLVTPTSGRGKSLASVAGGAGGAGGVGGFGGNVLISTEIVSAGSTFPVVIGSGGAGGEAGGASQSGSDGTASTFGMLSSSAGSPLPSGYLDELTGTVYATPGGNGIAGGAGGGREFKSGWQPIVNAEGVSGFGQTFSGGANSTGTISSTRSGVDASAQGGYGGGAAYGADGNDGATAAEDGYALAGYDPTGINIVAYARGAHGGYGADAIAPPIPSILGAGGFGGNGGGGAGSPGYAYGSYPSSGRYLEQAHQSLGGSGSDGGQGAPGAVLIYYKNPNN